MGKTVFRKQLVTPTQAREWMKKNVSNRNFNQSVSDGYSDEMKEGRWLLSPDAIAFNSKGELINGQHRLQAVISSGKSVEFLIMEGCDDEMKGITDLGRARSVPDMLKMMYAVNRAGLITGAIKALDYFVDNRRLKVTVGHALDKISVYDDGFKWATQSIPGKSCFAASPIVAALVYAYKSNPTRVAEFARQMFSGADLSDGSPVLQCRNFILTQGGAGSTRDEKRQTFLLVLTAVDRYVNRASPVRRLKAAEDAVSRFSAAYGA